MTEQEKIGLLEEIMDLDEGTLHVNDELSNFEEWDSMSALTYISEMDDRFGKKVTGSEVKSFVTVADAIALMN